MQLDEMRKIVDKVHYKDWGISIHSSNGKAQYLQVSFQALDVEEVKIKDVLTVYGRKWMLSDWMTESELVQTCLMAVLAAEEHEAREAFVYRGKRVFNPHISIRAMLGICGEQEKRP